jgi:hypothetical protein
VRKGLKKTSLNLLPTGPPHREQGRPYNCLVERRRRKQMSLASFEPEAETMPVK